MPTSSQRNDDYQIHIGSELAPRGMIRQMLLDHLGPGWTFTPIQREQGAKNRGDNWLSFANDVFTQRQTRAWQKAYMTEADWFVEIARQSGYKTNTVRRQQRTIEFLRDHLPPHVWHDTEDLEISFSAAELLARLYQLNQGEAKRLLPEVVTGRVGFSRVREIFAVENSAADAVRTGKNAVATRRIQFAKHAQTLVARNPWRFFPDIQAPVAVKPLRGFFFISPTWTVHGHDINGQPVITAFDARQFAADDEQYVLQRTLEQMLMMSQFCHLIWLIYPERNSMANDEFIYRLDEGLIQLQLGCVGIARIHDRPDDDCDDIVIFREPVNHYAPKSNLYLKHLGIGL